MKWVRILANSQADDDLRSLRDDARFPDAGGASYEPGIGVRVREAYATGNLVTSQFVPRKFLE